MGQYAKQTTVPVEKSKAEIEQILQRYGASEFAYGVREGKAMVGFVLEGRHIRMTLPMPSKTDEKFRYTEKGRWRHPGKRADVLAARSWEQECRQRWRALALAIKAKLEAVESGIATIEDEFLGYMVLPNGESFSEWATPQLEKLASGGKIPRLMA